MTIIASEIERFNRLGATWWNSAGPMRPLHVINELQLEYLRLLITEQFHRAVPSNREGLRILEIGCGAGLLCEPLSRSGAQVTAIDAAARNVAAARIHAASRGITIDYRVGDPAMALRPDERFDVVLLLEVVEHVTDVEAFVIAAGRHVAPGGLLIASTIDRTSKSFAVAIGGAEYLFRILPKRDSRLALIRAPRRTGVSREPGGARPRRSSGDARSPFDAPRFVGTRHVRELHRSVLARRHYATLFTLPQH